MLLSFLRDNWRDFTASPCPRDLQVATITSCDLDHGNDIVLIFVDRCRFPSYVMKICRSHRFAFKLNREFEALRWFSTDREPAIPVPRPYHLGSIGTRTFIIQEAIPATGLARLLTEHGLTTANRRLLEDAVDLLVQINQSPAGSHGVENRTLDPRVDLDSSDRARLGERARRLSDLKICQFAHGDYWPLNLLTRHNRIVGVIDWEFSIRAAAIPSDIVWFLVNVAYVLCMHEKPGISIERAFREVFFAKNPHTKVIRDLFGRWGSASGLDLDLFLPLLEATLAEMAQRELIAYGEPGKMDETCLGLLRHTLDNERDLQI